MSDDVKHGWQLLGEQMTALGALVQERLTAPEPSPADAPSDGATDQIKAALDHVVAATRELGERIGDVARDEDVRTTARQTMTSLDDAITATVDLIVSEVERFVTPSPSDEEAPPDSPPAPSSD